MLSDFVVLPQIPEFVLFYTFFSDCVDTFLSKTEDTTNLLPIPEFVIAD